VESGASRIFITNSPEETERLGAGLADGLNPGDIIGLVGELGGGKTCFVRGLARGLGLTCHVKSPSFNLLNIYEGGERCEGGEGGERSESGGRGSGEWGKTPLYHIDLYRLGGADDFFEAGLEEYIYSEGISVIEWADKFSGFLDRCAFVVSFAYVSERQRKITIERKRSGVGDAVCGGFEE